MLSALPERIERDLCHLALHSDLIGLWQGLADRQSSVRFLFGRLPASRQ